mgnify:FL=1
MELKIEKPIIFFDLESSGLNTESDRIVQIGAIKYNPDGTTEEKDVLVNPEIDIPLDASEVHGITNEMVADAPVFKRISVNFRKWLEGCDFAHFNGDSFDLPLLNAELVRAGLDPIDWEFNSVDVLKLYRQLYPNTLSDVYKRLTGKEPENAHNAVFDLYMTKEILDILSKDLEDSTPKGIDEFLQGDKKRYDIAGKMYKDTEGIVRWNFGKVKDQDVRLDPGFGKWFLGQNFPKESKDLYKKACEVK